MPNLNQAVQLLKKHAPEKLYTYEQNKGPHGFEFWLSSSSPPYGVPSAVHESIHQINSKLSGWEESFYSITENTTLRIPRLKTFDRSKIATYLPQSQKDNYYKEYLCGQCGAQGYDLVLEELNAYTHGCYTAVQLQQFYSENTRVSECDGLAVFMYYTQLYLRYAREHEPDTWNTLANDGSVVELTRILYSRAEDVMKLALAVPKLGINDQQKRELIAREDAVEYFLSTGAEPSASSKTKPPPVGSAGNLPEDEGKWTQDPPVDDSEKWGEDPYEEENQRGEEDLDEEEFYDEDEKWENPSREDDENPFHIGDIIRNAKRRATTWDSGPSSQKIRGYRRITINGQEYSGNSIEVNNGKVIVDGVEQDGDSGNTSSSISVTINGKRII